jgi:phosphatidylserine/phosphatidylglycerophosphate/cardiolipin synthase-like enzyme
MSLFRAAIALCLLLAAPLACTADPAAVVHYAPEENLERIDVALIDGARTSLDMAAYVLTDWPVMQALDRAARRGVAVRLTLDGGAMLDRAPTVPLRALIDNPGVTIRVKRAGGALMHLKSYQIDGRLLRTGAANFSASGLKRQDNDLIVIESSAAVARFLRRFETIYAASESFPQAAASSAGDDPRQRRRRESRESRNAGLPPATATIPD